VDSGVSALLLAQYKKPAGRAFLCFSILSSEYQTALGLLPRFRGDFGLEGFWNQAL
jgi:hypothetical protein